MKNASLEERFLSTKGRIIVKYLSYMQYVLSYFVYF